MLPRILVLLAASISCNAAVTETCRNVEFTSSAMKYPPIALASRTSGAAAVLIRLDKAAMVVSVSPLRSTSALLVQQTKINAEGLKFVFSTAGRHQSCDLQIDFEYKIVPGESDAGYLRVTFESGTRVIIEAKPHRGTVNY